MNYLQQLQVFLGRNTTAARMTRILLILGCAAILIGELAWEANPRHAVFIDFQNDYNAALALRHGLNPLAPAAAWVHSAQTSASQGAAVGGLYYTYAPIFALVQVPLTFLPLTTAFVVWDVCSLIFLVGSVYACLRVAGLRPTVAHLLVLTTVVALFHQMRSEYSLGQVDVFLLFLVCAAFWAQASRRTALAAVLLGLACVTKPVLLPFVAFLLWKREFRFAFSTVLAFAVLLLAPFVVLGGQALRDQLDIWRYWSNEYATYIGGYAPKNVLARIFSPNPYVQPIVNAPQLTTILWMLVVAVVVVVTAAVVSPRRLAMDAHTLFEIGLVATALLLVSPLTEGTYMFQLVIPVIGCYCYLLWADWRTPGVRLVAAGLAVTWLLLYAPYEKLLPWMNGTSLTSRLYTSLVFEAIPLYIMIAFFALQLRLQHVLSGVSTVNAVKQFVRTAPALAQQWIVDAGLELKRLTSRVSRQAQETPVTRAR